MKMETRDFTRGREERRSVQRSILVPSLGAAVNTYQWAMEEAMGVQNFDAVALFLFPSNAK